MVVIDMNEKIYSFLNVKGRSIPTQMFDVSIMLNLLVLGMRIVDSKNIFEIELSVCIATIIILLYLLIKKKAKASEKNMCLFSGISFCILLLISTYFFCEKVYKIFDNVGMICVYLVIETISIILLIFSIKRKVNRGFYLNFEVSQSSTVASVSGSIGGLVAITVFSMQRTNPNFDQYIYLLVVFSMATSGLIGVYLLIRYYYYIALEHCKAHGDGLR